MKTKMMMAVPAALAAVLLLGGCVEPYEGAAAPVDTATSQAPEPAPPETPEPEQDPAVWAKQMHRAAVASNGGRSIKKGCHLPEYTWQCFFDRVGSPYVGRLDVHLAFSGDVSRGEADAMAAQSRTWFMNMAGINEPSLDLVVSFSNGVDSGMMYRSDSLLLRD